ncbi:la-related protein 6A-like [Magnolia sinica]|uniref:la-related protein 6A-like n=1 Tax=Magnolia sinica TaxID=86752 RepID=UPI00265ABA26|nr:la-related protein 6A-like [Magnolia sinica]
MAVIASFRKMKKLVQDISLVEAALRTPSQLVVSSDGKKVKRLHALPDIDIEDAKLHTVLVENLPDAYSTESIQRIFGDVGNIKNICIHNPHSTEESTKASKAEKVISSKVNKPNLPLASQFSGFLETTACLIHDCHPKKAINFLMCMFI